MANITPPRQVQLVRSDLPEDTWATLLVSAFNQFVVQTCAAFGSAVTQYKTITFMTGAVVSDSFPIDVPVDRVPDEVRVAQFISGQSALANTAQWSPTSGARSVRISLITGLSPNTSYEIKLALE